MSEPDLPEPDICTEAEIRGLVHTFYAKARADAALGPVFEAQVHDRDEHLATLSDFWSAVLLGTRRFTGMPMPKHAAMPHLSAELFERWLALWGETLAALPNRALADAAGEMAKRMARSLWYGYQLSRDALLDAVWGENYFASSRTLDQHIVQIRRKLGESGNLIETVRGTGYRLRQS